MREVFKPVKKDEVNADVVYYTITQQDVGESVFIETTVGKIPINMIMGRIQPNDVGKRFYRVPAINRNENVWQVENNRQRDQRVGE